MNQIQFEYLATNSQHNQNRMSMHSRLTKSNSNQSLQSKMFSHRGSTPKKAIKKQIKLSLLIMQQDKERNKQMKQSKIQKLSFVHQQIEQIDQLPSCHYCYYSLVKVLYLSGNLIRSLQNIHHFANLQSLSLANNQIAQISTIRYLQPLQKLSNLILQHNPVSKCTMYIPFTIGMVKNLKMLDHMTVQCADRQSMLQVFRIYEEINGQLLKNYANLFQLVNFYRKLDIHSVVLLAKRRIERQNLSSCQRSQCHSQSQNEFLQYSQHKENYTLDADRDYVSNVNKLLKFCEPCSDLPAKVLLSFQNTIYYDLQSIKSKLNSQLKTKSKYELFFSAMHILRRKQASKQQQLKSRIIQKSRSIYGVRNSQNTTNQADIQKVCHIFQKLYATQNQSLKLARIYRQTNIIQKCFKILYFRVLEREKKNTAAKKIGQILLINLVTKSYRPCFQHFNQVSRQKGLQIFIDKLNKIIIVCFKRQILAQINQYSKKTQNFCETFSKLQRKYWMKEGFSWFIRNLYFKDSQQKNLVLERQIKQARMKQEKYKEKIKLLERLLEISEQRNMNQLPDFCLQKDCLSLRQQNQATHKNFQSSESVIYSSSAFSNVDIKKSNYKDSQKENLNNLNINQYAIENGQSSRKIADKFIQRKLNQSRRNNNSLIS